MTLAEIVTIGVLFKLTLTATFFAYRYRKARAPLTIAPTLAFRYGSTEDTYQCRVHLGPNRIMRQPAITAVFTTETGHSTSLTVDAPTVRPVVGPYTVIIRDNERVLRQPGQVRIDAVALSAKKCWSATTIVPHTHFIAGRFCDVIRHGRRGLAIKHRSWRAIRPDTAPTR